MKTCLKGGETMKLEEIIEKYPESCANCLNFKVFRDEGIVKIKCVERKHNKTWKLKKYYDRVPVKWLNACNKFTFAG